MRTRVRSDDRGAQHQLGRGIGACKRRQIGEGKGQRNDWLFAAYRNRCHQVASAVQTISAGILAIAIVGVCRIREQCMFSCMRDLGNIAGCTCHHHPHAQQDDCQCEKGQPRGSAQGFEAKCRLLAVGHRAHASSAVSCYTISIDCFRSAERSDQFWSRWASAAPGLEIEGWPLIREKSDNLL